LISCKMGVVEAILYYQYAWFKELDISELGSV